MSNVTYLKPKPIVVRWPKAFIMLERIMREGGRKPITLAKV